MKKEFSKFIEIKDIKNNLNNLPIGAGIYALLLPHEINRLVGSSPILKIGQSKKLKKRIRRYFSSSIESIKDQKSRQTAFRFRRYLNDHKKVVVNLLYMSVQDNPFLDIVAEEKRLLKIYFEEHFEVPPLNMSLK
jgi:hypothetical protein